MYSISNNNVKHYSSSPQTKIDRRLWVAADKYFGHLATVNLITVLCNLQNIRLRQSPLPPLRLVVLLKRKEILRLEIIRFVAFLLNFCHSSSSAKETDCIDWLLYIDWVRSKCGRYTKSRLCHSSVYQMDGRVLCVFSGCHSRPSSSSRTPTPSAAVWEWPCVASYSLNRRMLISCKILRSRFAHHVTWRSSRSNEGQHKKRTWILKCLNRLKTLISILSTSFKRKGHCHAIVIYGAASAVCWQRY